MKTVTICIGSSCHLKGSHDVVLRLQKLIKKMLIVFLMNTY